MNRTAGLIFAATLVGCATPLPVAEFDPTTTANGRHFNTYASRELPYGDVNTFAQVRQAMRAYQNLYLEEADKKRLQAQSAGEVSFLSSILGVLGGVAKSQDVAIAGGGVAAGAGLYTDRYRLTVQAKNYEMAADALSCMYHLLPGGAEAWLTAYRIRGTTESAESAFRSAALESLRFVHLKIRDLQSTFTFGQADVNKLKDALKREGDKIDPPSAEQKRAFAATNNAPEPEIGALENYRKELKACESKISG